MSNEQAMSDLARILDTPIVFIMLGVIAGIMISIFHSVLYGEPREAKKAQEFAADMATRNWYVQERKVAGPENRWVSLVMREVANPKSVARIAIRPGHPDIERFKSLQKLDIVEFTALEKPLESALLTELCAYIRLKEVTSWN